MKHLNKATIAIILLTCSLGLAKDTPKNQQYVIIKTQALSPNDLDSLGIHCDELCQVKVRDVDQPKTTLTLTRSIRFHDCDVPEVGTIISGQREGNKIRLTFRNNTTKWRIAFASLAEDLEVKINGEVKIKEVK